MSMFKTAPSRHRRRLPAVLLALLWGLLTLMLIASETHILGLSEAFSQEPNLLLSTALQAEGVFLELLTYPHRLGFKMTDIAQWYMRDGFTAVLLFLLLTMAFAVASLVLPWITRASYQPLILTLGFLGLAAVYLTKMPTPLADLIAYWIASLDPKLLIEAESIGAPLLEQSPKALSRLTDYPEGAAHSEAMRLLAWLQPITAEPGLVMPSVVSGSPRTEYWVIAPLVMVLLPLAIALSLGVTILQLGRALAPRDTPKAERRRRIFAGGALVIGLGLLLVPLTLAPPLPESRNYELVRRAVAEEHGKLAEIGLDWTLRSHVMLHKALGI